MDTMRDGRFTSISVTTMRVICQFDTLNGNFLKGSFSVNLAEKPKDIQ